ncbi:MAG: hypothetical protein AAGG01_02750, partial [Planctomycetota bacterium]
EGGEPPKILSSLREPPQISQRGRRFTPTVLPVTVGSTVRFPNDDSVFHNVFSLSKAAPFDLGIYKRGESREVRFDATGLVKVYCNIHPDMAANVIVLPNPWFAVCSADGSFVLDDVPSGSYKLRAWTARGGAAAVAFEIEERAAVTINLAASESGGAKPHKNKFGREYSSKYR